jgi:hypothetical protein
MEKYNYETSCMNEFYKKVLKNSGEKWINGLRWVHGEEFL